MSTPSASEPLTIDPALVARFRRDFGSAIAAAFDGEMLDDTAPIGLAVSGGPDSMAMLALANAAFPGRIRVATVDHGLRPDATDEARLVADACATMEVPHTTLRPNEPITGSSIQMRAREARYAALAVWAEENGVWPILTAHHADDQAETLLMRLNRASGISGLAAIRRWRFLSKVDTPAKAVTPASEPGSTVPQTLRHVPPVQAKPPVGPRHGGRGDDKMRVVSPLLIRPLLGWRRAELGAIVIDAGLPFVDDPSNRDPRHDRTRIRTLLAERPDLDPVALAASAGYLAEAEQVIADRAETLWLERWHGPDRELAIADLPRELQRRLLRRAVAETRAAHAIAQPPFTDSTAIEPLIDSLAADRPAVQGGVLVRPSRDGANFAPAPPRRRN